MLVPRFIADRDYLATRPVRVIERRWDQGDSRMNALVDGWEGQPVWGESRNT
jgi:hypothetical protein